VVATGRACGESSVSSAQASGSSMAVVDARDTDADGWSEALPLVVASSDGECVNSCSRSEAKPARTVCALLGRALGRAMTKERVLGRQVVVGRGLEGEIFCLGGMGLVWWFIKKYIKSHVI
jgi:hypothetical protein